VDAHAEPGGPVCQADGTRFTPDALFGVQRERVLDGLATVAAGEMRSVRRAALGPRRSLIDAMLADGVVPPLELARLLGREAAEGLVAAVRTASSPLADLIAHAEDVRRRGIRLPVRWLGARLSEALEGRLAALPEGAADALALLDLAAATGARLDLGRAQVQMLSWWQANPPEGRSTPTLAALCARLHVAPESA
jgi:hypothetical protein